MNLFDKIGESLARIAKSTTVAETKDQGARYDPNAIPDPNCKACQQKWPIHVDGKGKRSHIDVIGFHKDYGFGADCPTDFWPSGDEHDSGDESVTKTEDIQPDGGSKTTNQEN